MDCLLIVSFRYRNSLQQVFEMSSLCANARLQTLSPLADSSVIFVNENENENEKMMKTETKLKRKIEND